MLNRITCAALPFAAASSACACGTLNPGRVRSKKKAAAVVSDLLMVKFFSLLSTCDRHTAARTLLGTSVLAGKSLTRSQLFSAS